MRPCTLDIVVVAEGTNLADLRGWHDRAVRHEEIDLIGRVPVEVHRAQEHASLEQLLIDTSLPALRRFRRERMKGI